MLLYFLLTGDYPARVSGLTLQQAVAEISKRKPLIDVRPDLSESLVRTVETAMETDPSKRFNSAGQLASALAESLGAHSSVEAAVTPARPARKYARPWLLAGTALLVAVVGYLAWSGALHDLLHRTTGADATPGPGGDQFQRAQDLLLHSYKESNLAQAVAGFEAVLKAVPAMRSPRHGWAPRTSSSTTTATIPGCSICPGRRPNEPSN